MLRVRFDLFGEDAHGHGERTAAQDYDQELEFVDRVEVSGHLVEPPAFLPDVADVQDLSVEDRDEPATHVMPGKRGELFGALAVEVHRKHRPEVLADVRDDMEQLVAAEHPLRHPGLRGLVEGMAVLVSVPLANFAEVFVAFAYFLLAYQVDRWPGALLGEGRA